MATRLSMKLLIDRSSQRVLFAEAGKDVVDLLFSLLQLPVGTVVKLLAKKDMAGGIANVYDSLDNLDGAYLQPDRSKDAFLNPSLSPADAGSSPPMLLLLPAAQVSPSPNSKKLTKAPDRSNGPEIGAGLVNAIVTFMVMDDLSVKPMSSISSITLLSKLGVKDFDALEEKTVKLGVDEGLELLKASMQSKTVLTDVFIKNKTETETPNAGPGSKKRRR